MSDYKILLQPAYILHQRKYRETSLILDVLTEDFGIIPLLAKGVRKAKSKTMAILQPFLPLAVSYLGKSDLKTLTHAEIIAPAPVLNGSALFCGLYLNELVKHFLHPYDPYSAVFNHYRQCLQQLSNINENREVTLRLFELSLLETIGYGLPLDFDCNNDSSIDSHKRYQFLVTRGAFEAQDGQFSGATLIALRNKKLDNRLVLAEAKILMRKVIDHHLGDKTLHSRVLFKSTIPYKNNN
jgi:DNA repair protein RecO (recombination protein O)